jgi:hypothetical protein
LDTSSILIYAEVFHLLAVHRGPTVGQGDQQNY